jgi:hypothetical protein
MLRHMPIRYRHRAMLAAMDRFEAIVEPFLSRPR